MAIVYRAPKPKYSNWEWFKLIGTRIAFPPVLLWDLIKFGMNKLLGEFVGSIVLLAQGGDFKQWAVTDDTVHRYNKVDLTCEKHEVITYDDAHLDTFEVKHQSQKNIEPSNQKYIINFVGNGMCYEHIIDDMIGDARALQANVVGFNFRGVAQSKKTDDTNQSGKRAQSKNDLVTDGIAQVQRLLDQGVSAKNITLKGHSLGAGIASLVALHFHQLGQPINIFNSRSFSTITNHLVGHIRLERDQNERAIGHKETLGGKILGWLAKPFIKFALALTKWEINAGSAFKSIPTAYRDYVVVRSRKEVRDERVDDEVIPHYASIHEELQQERRAKKAEIDGEIKQLDKMIKNADLDVKPELLEAREHLVKARSNIKNARKMETDDPLDNGHMSDWSSLHNRSGKSAQTFFREFVQRANADHAEKYSLEP